MLNDFTLAKYEELCRKLNALNRPVIRFDEFFANPEEHYAKPFIILRHDVDRWPVNALKMAQVENAHGLKSTYYFRFVSGVFKPEIIKKIADLGHEIGFHYETLAKAKGSIPKALDIFQFELDQLRKISPVVTICMHGSPLSPFDNRDLWRENDFRKFGITGEPYLSIDYKKVFYYTDTGRTWGKSAANLRDKVVDEQEDKPQVTSTSELIEKMQHISKPIIIQTHPERWSYSFPTYLRSFAADKAVNLIKIAVKALR